MKTNKSNKGAYAGAGAGLVLFGLFGLMPGSVVGGAVGISAAGALFGLPLDPGILPRSIVLGGMLLGVMASGLAMITASATVGWLVEQAVHAAVHPAAAKNH